ncbi:membrane integrity-associated transporter subunit PqiC [Bacillus sp. NP157]|nr:membrane integrity-associated transporter subunit PqiC [Bacillus sp. NP157]
MIRARLVLPMVIACVAGCSILPKAETPSVYTLPAAAGARPANIAPVAWGLRIATPSAARALDNPRIAVMPDASTITVYASARWSDTSPHLFRDRLADAFRDSARITALSTDDSNVAADYELGGNLAAFQTEYNGGKPEVVIRFDAMLAATRKHQIVASQRFEVREPIDGKEVPQVVQAFGRAMDKLSRDVVGWTYTAAK